MKNLGFLGLKICQNVGAKSVAFGVKKERKQKSFSRATMAFSYLPNLSKKY